ncbi:dynamin family protein [Jeotgalibacillus campisalis]|uniref:Dynamin N-terminal domain-containing protein n=1 Tax=Jeotgalibacillus campisalis TaxID=220754 RepID=A0A0C2VF34_9BACL|nr:dynamin family protein [Jeotgalibacillus campisalis]KIL43136.1 hypothetical protein KR50_35390 [Jeotgalibacillus campisalis]
MFQKATDLNELNSYCNKLIDALETTMPNSSYLKPLIDIRNNLDSNEVIISVLGEFKRGKSTLINAILQRSILPEDVLPSTAAVNEIRNGTGSEAFLFDAIDQSVGTIPIEELRSYTFSGENYNQEVAKITLETELPFNNKMVTLVDTPGVGDLNDHELDITHHYIPMSDIILFVINASAALSKSEMQFLKDVVLKLKNGEIIFVLNFRDRVDEEELEDIESDVRRKLKNVLTDKQLNVFFVSSLEAKEDPSEPSFKYLMHILDERSSKGTLAKSKLKFYQNQLQQLKEGILVEAKELDRLKLLSNEKIEQEKKTMEKFLDGIEGNSNEIKRYVTKKQDEILMITRKSLFHFQDRLIEETLEDIDSFHQGDFAGYIEKTLPLQIKRKINAWVNANSANVSTLLKQLDDQVTKSIRHKFSNISTDLSTRFTVFQYQGAMNDLAKSKVNSKAYFESGLLAGGAAALFLASGMFLLLPVLSLAGLPFINDLIGKRKLQAAKLKLTPEVEKSIHDLIMKIDEGLKIYVETTSEQIASEQILTMKRTASDYYSKKKTHFDADREVLHTLPDPIPVLNLINGRNDNNE